MNASFNSLSKDVTRDMTQTLTSVNEKVAAFNVQVESLNESQKGINKILAGVKKYGTLAEFSLGSLIKDLLPKTPAKLDAHGIELDGKPFKGTLSLAMIYPNPLNPQKMVAFLTGNSKKMERLSLYALPLYSGSGIPPYMIFDMEVKQYGWGGVRAAGFFNEQGKPEK